MAIKEIIQGVQQQIYFLRYSKDHQDVADPELRDVLKRFDFRVRRIKFPIAATHMSEYRSHSDVYDAVRGEFMDVGGFFRTLRRLKIIDTVPVSRVRPSRVYGGLDLSRIQAARALSWQVEKQFRYPTRLVDCDDADLWKNVVTPTRIALGESPIKDYINDPLEAPSPISGRRPSSKQAQPLRAEAKTDTPSAYTKPEDVKPKALPSTSRAESKPAVASPAIPIRKPQIETSLGKQTIEVLQGWDVNRIAELLNLIPPNYDSVTGAQLPPEVEGLTRMVLNMVYLQRNLPLLTHEDVLSNNQARLAIGIMHSNLTSHPKIGNLANLYKLCQVKIEKDQSSA